MRSIKPGRGPSAMGAIGSIAVGIFGVFWTIGAASMGAPIVFVLFGIVFVGIAIVQGIYHANNATGKNRMSLYDITDNEPDPLDRYFTPPAKQDGHQTHAVHEVQEANEDRKRYCPYCGNRIDDLTYQFCPKCGKEIER